MGSDKAMLVWVLAIVGLAAAAAYLSQDAPQQITGLPVSGDAGKCCNCPPDKVIGQEGEGSGTTLEAGLKACCADADSKKTDPKGACAEYCISPPEGCGCCTPTNEGSTGTACSVTKINDVGMDDIDIDFDKGTIKQKSTNKIIGKTDSGKKKINCVSEFKCGCACNCEERLKDVQKSGRE